MLLGEKCKSGSCLTLKTSDPHCQQVGTNVLVPTRTWALLLLCGKTGVSLSSVGSLAPAMMLNPKPRASEGFHGNWSFKHFFSACGSQEGPLSQVVPGSGRLISSELPGWEPADSVPAP